MNLAVQAETKQVVVTIKPIHALVSGVMDGVNIPYLLLQGSESPHNYSLRPSQVRQLHNANLVIWIGPVESFLEKTITTLSDKTEYLRLLDVQGLTLLKARHQGETWEIHHHGNYHDNGFDIDPHIWLNPQNAKVIVSVIVRTLSRLDAPNAIHYSANAKRLVARLDQLDQTLKRQLAPIKDLPYLVFHDAYQYFENRYELKAMDAINLSPEVRLSARRLHQLRTSIKTQQIRCVYSEPQFDSALVLTIIEGTSVRHGILDPIGADLAAGTESYFILLQNMAKSLNQCLLAQ